MSKVSHVSVGFVVYQYTYVLNNPLKYPDPSGYKYQYDRYKWESSWEEGAAMYYQMAEKKKKALYYSYGGGGMGGYSQMEKSCCRSRTKMISWSSWIS